jgi:hypothetical protein
MRLRLFDAQEYGLGSSMIQDINIVKKPGVRKAIL